MSYKPTLNKFGVNNTKSNSDDDYRHRATHRNVQVGASRDMEEEVYMYKAKKYHNKCYTKLLDMKKNAERTNPGQPWTCPSGFSKYLSPFQV